MKYEIVSSSVSRSFKPSQSQRIISGLRETFIERKGPIRQK